jgi:hypothetical protein
VLQRGVAAGSHRVRRSPSECVCVRDLLGDRFRIYTPAPGVCTSSARAHHHGEREWSGQEGATRTVHNASAGGVRIANVDRRFPPSKPTGRSAAGGRSRDVFCARAEDVR